MPYNSISVEVSLSTITAEMVTDVDFASSFFIELAYQLECRSEASRQSFLEHMINTVFEEEDEDAIRLFADISKAFSKLEKVNV